MAHELNLESLGLTKDEIAERVVERIVESVLRSVGVDQYGDEEASASRFASQLQEKVLAQTNIAIEQIAGRHILPNVEHYVETLCLTETNKWGEKKGRTLTFVEYLVDRAEHYLTEKVDFNGKGREEAGNYSWSGTQTRITHLVHQHLHYSIEKAMKSAIAAVNSSIAAGIEGTVKQKVAEIASALSITVRTK